MTWVQRWYLEFWCAIKYPEQEPQYVNVRWYHALWLLVPVIGPLGFMQCVPRSRQ